MPGSAAGRPDRPAGRKLRRASCRASLHGRARGGRGKVMAAPPPTIFSPARRMAARRRLARLQQRADAARFLIEDIVEDTLERLAFLRHEPRKALVVGDWSGELAEALRRRGAEGTGAELGEGFD